MRSELIFFTFVLVLLQIECSVNLLSLLREKYKDDLDRIPIPRTFVDKNGQTVTVSLPRPMSMASSALRNDRYVEKLQNFEESPEHVIYYNRTKSLVIFHVVADYDTNPCSRKIINYCLQFNPDPGYIEMLLASAVRQNVVSVIEKLITMFDLSLVEDRDDSYDYQEKSFTKAVVKSGNYHIAKDLILRGFLLDSAVVWYITICRFPELNHLDSVIDFINFLITTTEMLDVNQYIGGYPLLTFTLAGNAANAADLAFRRAVAEHLLTLGADPKAGDRFGRTASEYPQAEGIQFPDTN